MRKEVASSFKLLRCQPLHNAASLVRATSVAECSMWVSDSPARTLSFSNVDDD